MPVPLQFTVSDYNFGNLFLPGNRNVIIIDICLSHLNMIPIYEKKSLNSDGHQFHQYQQKEQSPLISTELTKSQKRTRHMTLEIQVMAWNRYRNLS